MERRSTNGRLGNTNAMVGRLVGNETGLFCEFGGWKEREKRWTKDENTCSGKCAGSKFTFLNKLCIVSSADFSSDTWNESNEVQNERKNKDLMYNFSYMAMIILWFA